MLVVREHPLSLRERAYLRGVGVQHCSLLERSRALGRLAFLRCDLRRPRSPEQAQRALVLLTLIHVERFRVLRERAAAALCINLVIPSTAVPVERHRALLDQAHWYGKLLYTGDAVMLGKFAAGVGEHAEDGRSLPVPPFTFLSIRSALRERDRRFFDGGDVLSRRFDAARPRSTSPLADVPGCAESARLIRDHLLSARAVEPGDLLDRLRAEGLDAALSDWRRAEEARLGVAA